MRRQYLPADKLADFITVIIIAAIILMLRFATPGEAGPLEDADAAIKRRDYATAVRLIRPLAEQGDANAQYKLGVFYDNGLGVPQDKICAYMWLNRRRAEKVRQLFETLSHGANPQRRKRKRKS